MTDASSMLVGASEEMGGVRALIRKAALTTEPVLLRGEPGTGKELAARAIHVLSAAEARPFVKVDCSSFSETLLESELFGSVMSGGLLSAVPRIKPGRVDQAQGGTLLLESVSELPRGCQEHLLRLMTQKQYWRIGSTEVLQSRVRVMATTSRSLPELVKAGTFREDLCACLSAVQIGLPSLRDRQGDFEVLVRHFLDHFAPRYGHQRASITSGALAGLAARTWYGNVRELEDFIERSVVMAPPGDIIIDEATLAMERAPSTPPVRRESQLERESVEMAMKEAGGNQARAARILGVSRRTLCNKLEALGLATGEGGKG